MYIGLGTVVLILAIIVLVTMMRGAGRSPHRSVSASVRQLAARTCGLHNKEEGRPMGIVVSMLLIAAGAIMRYAVTVEGNGFNVGTAGIILMIVGYCRRTPLDRLLGEFGRVRAHPTTVAGSAWPSCASREVR